MKEHEFSWELFEKLPIIGILRNYTRDEINNILPVYQEAGFFNIEITMNTPGAVELIRHASKNYGGVLNVGAGTVCNTKELESALKAGAQFIVSPVVDEDLIQDCVERKIPVFPGAFTPTEIYQAWTFGASMVKVFPATKLGLTYIKEVKAPLDQIKLLPTGGVNLDNFIEFLEAGSSGLGMGGQLFKKEFIQKNDWDGLKNYLQQFVAIYSDYKSQQK
ncbi:bifunctional 4-hydroxy-2-oxoglutarate aldolase/2-dehydro-3-deoxy-phosphogluconate aldolase [Flexithrix dorotheae]|uniref:bifunctional 4-hydroxy-2-oxoglutarate aldolase/2-dehydro-3-deoxy-phosphogluconate aldolase n=1 Tax=Flexithrix dorotheae TaxID=70993 RepID=UPI0003690691|nr:bifunctional 4-hydroxy-2-oxoglutarate aldolase/2-dehydro-3-deoxy-phosphogluconate aldolase [Flexithrix dorotheae]